MSRTSQRRLGYGVYAPLPTFFYADGRIDWESYKRHVTRLIAVGIVPLCLGSLGEAVHLSPQERCEVIRFVRAILDEANLYDTPIIAGVGAASTRETIALASDASKAGADFGMVIPPAYYSAALGQDEEQVVQYYVDVCEESPIPILLYNFPANAGGQDLSSHTIEKILRRAPNLCGVKLTCGGSMGKMIRLKHTLDTDKSLDSARAFPFVLVDGLIGDLSAWMMAGGHGTTSGIPNFAPHASMRLFDLLRKVRTTEEEEEMREIQGILSKADISAVPGGVRAMKYALSKLYGYSIYPRRPLLPLSDGEGERFMFIIHDMMQLEARCAVEPHEL